MWSEFHRGDYQRMRRGLTIALLEAEAMEPRVQLAYTRGPVPSVLTADMSLVRLLLERADVLTRHASTRRSEIPGCTTTVYAETVFTDDGLVEAA